MVTRLSAGPLRLALVPELGGSIARFDWDDGAAEHAILHGHDAPATPLDAACFPLVPFCNRIRGGRFLFRGREVRLPRNMPGDASPLHGQGWQRPWTVEQADDRTATLGFRHPSGDWPWHFSAQQCFTLDERGLTVDLRCTNEDAEPMPCGLGLHPYFPCGPGTRLATQVEHVWTVDADILPVARVPAVGRYAIDDRPACGRGLDNGYDGWSGEAMIETPGLPFRLRMSSPNARFFQLYSPAGGGLFVAEPVSHANAALNAPEAEWPTLGLRVLAPGEAMTLRMRLDVEAPGST